MRTGNLKPNRNYYKHVEIPNESPNMTINGTSITLTGTGGVENILGGVYGQFITVQQKPGPTGVVIFGETGNIVVQGTTVTLQPSETRCFYYDQGFDKWLDCGNPGLRGPDGMSGFEGMAGAEGVLGMPGTAGVDGTTGVDGIGGELGDQGVQGAAGESGIMGENGGNGADGDLGVTGEQGPIGEQGQQGPPCM